MSATGLAEAESALVRIPGPDRGRVLEQLADGPTNASYLVEQNGERLVLRLDKPGAGALGLDRASERRVCEALAAAGLLPAHRHFDAAGGITLRPWVAGRSLVAGDLFEPATLTELAAVLRRLHGLAPVGRRFEPLADARRYARQLGTSEAADLARQAEAVLAASAPGEAAAALCHNDLVAANIVRPANGTLVLIDWEYAGIGDPYFDLAVVVRHHQLGADLARHFLEAYLERGPRDAEHGRLAQQCEFYGCLLALWNLRVGL